MSGDLYEDAGIEEEVRAAAKRIARARAPLALHMRVAAIPGDHPRAGRLPGRFGARPRLGVAAAFAAVLVVTGAVIYAGLPRDPRPISGITSGPASLAPTAPPSAAPSAAPPTTAPATPGPAKCASDNYTTYSPVGWRGGRVVVLADHFIGCDLRQELLSVDPAVGEWRSDATLDTLVTDFTIASDGQSVAALSADGVLIVDANGTSHALPRPAGTDESWGDFGLRPLPKGAYIVVGAEQLSVLASDGSGITTTPLPKGYVVVAPTSDLDRYIITPIEDAAVPYGLVRSPFRAYLWNLKSGALKLVAPSVTAVESTPHALAYLELAAGGYRSLAVGGTLTPVTLPAVAIAQMRSPDGSRYLYVPDPSSVEPQMIELRETATGRVLGQFRGAIGPAAWRATTAAAVSGGGTAPSELVILDGSSYVTHVLLP